MDRQEQDQPQTCTKTKVLREYIGLSNTKGAKALVNTLLTRANGSVTAVKLELNRSGMKSITKQTSKIDTEKVIKKNYTNTQDGMKQTDKTKVQTDDIPRSIMYLTVNYNGPQLRGTTKGGDKTESAYYNKLERDVRERWQSI